MINDGTAQWKIIDVKQDAEEISSVKDKVDSAEQKIEALEENMSEVNNFAIVYPNGGSKEKPANVTRNSRYETPNPFPGYHIMCKTELLLNGRWGQYDGVIYAGVNGIGILSNQLLPDDIVVTQTGAGDILSVASNDCGPWKNHLRQDTLPCRVLIYKLGKIKE